MIDLTVITASFGRPSLAACVASVQAQEVPVVAHLIRVARPDPLGPRHNAFQLSTLAAAADTEWVAVLDDDDLWYPHHTQTVAPYLDGPFDVIHTWASGAQDLRPDSYEGRTAELAKLLEYGNYLPGGAAIRRSTLDWLGYWAEEDCDAGTRRFGDSACTWQDWYLWLNMARHGARFITVPTVTWQWRRGEWPADAEIGRP